MMEPLKIGTNESECVVIGVLATNTYDYELRKEFIVGEVRLGMHCNVIVICNSAVG